MNRVFLAMAVGLIVASATFSCTPAPKEPKQEIKGPKQQVIEILQPENIYEYGKLKFAVGPGDELEVIRSKVCRSGYGICLEIRDIKTGRIGYVREVDMERRHRIYTR